MRKGILVNDTSSEHHIGCDTVVANIKRLSKEVGIEITQTFTRQQVRNKLCKEAFKTCDIIIVNGEGSLHDGYGRGFLTDVVSMIPDGKPAVLINSLWYNMGKVSNMNKFSIISFRETRSYNEFIANYPELKDKTMIVPDVIFALEIPIERIGTGDSVYSNKANELSVCDNYFPLDYKRTSKAQFPNKIETYKPNDVYIYIKWLKSLNLYITGRFHGVCLSAIAGTPVLAIVSNTKKIEALLQDMTGISDSYNLIITTLTDIDNKKEIAIKLSAKVHQYALDAKDRIKNLFVLIGNIRS